MATAPIAASHAGAAANVSGFGEGVENSCHERLRRRAQDAAEFEHIERAAEFWQRAGQMVMVVPGTLALGPNPDEEEKFGLDPFNAPRTRA